MAKSFHHYIISSCIQSRSDNLIASLPLKRLTAVIPIYEYPSELNKLMFSSLLTLAPYYNCLLCSCHPPVLITQIFYNVFFNPLSFISQPPPFRSGLSLFFLTLSFRFELIVQFSIHCKAPSIFLASWVTDIGERMRIQVMYVRSDADQHGMQWSGCFRSKSI